MQIEIKRITPINGEVVRSITETWKYNMPAFEVDYSGKELIFATHPVNALDDDEAEDFTIEYVKETYPELLDVTIESIRKLKD